MKQIFTLATCLIITALLHAQIKFFVTPGGTGDGSGPGTRASNQWGIYYYNNNIRNSYLNIWGGSYGGGCRNVTGALVGQGTYSIYWSQSTQSAKGGFHMEFMSDGLVRPKGYYDKDNGYHLRCIR